MPSKHEGIPITTIEAMACLTPSILYNVPGLRDFNKNKECSKVIEEDYNALAKTIVELYRDKKATKPNTQCKRVCRPEL